MSDYNNVNNMDAYRLYMRFLILFCSLFLLFVLGMNEVSLLYYSPDS